MDLVPKIGITGLPRVGKTEALKKVVGELEGEDFKVGGMITTSIIENGRRVGFKVIDWMNGEEEVFAHVDIESYYMVGRYKIDLKALERIGIPAIQRAIEDENVDVIIIDEVGRMELMSEKFRSIVREALECDKPILITLHKKSRDPLLQDIRKMDDVRILEITPVNRNLLPFKIGKILKESLIS
jgi:nucleoside-triphosphatase